MPQQEEIKQLALATKGPEGPKQVFVNNDYYQSFTKGVNEVCQGFCTEIPALLNEAQRAHNVLTKAGMPEFSKGTVCKPIDPSASTKAGMYSVTCQDNNGVTKGEFEVFPEK